MDAPPLSQSPIPVTASALIATLYQTFSHGSRALRIDGSSMLTFRDVSLEFIQSIWQHAYRRAEDEMILVASASASAQSPFLSVIENFPTIDQGVVQAVRVLQPFLTHTTPDNLNTIAHTGLGLSLSLNSEGSVISSRITMPEQPLATLAPLLDLAYEKGNRSFDVFYHVLFAELDRADLLGLKKPSQYALLEKSGTYTLPPWVVFADDRALAKDWAAACTEVFSREFHRDLMATISGILLMGQPDKNSRAEGASLIGLDHALSSSYSPKELISAAYITLLEAVISNINHHLGSFDAQGSQEVSSVVTIVETGLDNKYEIINPVFNDAEGINAEMSSNGIMLARTPKNVQKALQKLSPFSPIRLTSIPDFTAICSDNISWARTTVRKLGQNYSPLDIKGLVPSNRIWNVLSVACAVGAEQVNKDAWSSSIISEQLRDYYVNEWADKRGSIDFTADFGVGDFIAEFRSILPSGQAGFQIANWVDQRGYSPADFFLGKHRIYVSEPVWQTLEREKAAAEGFVQPGRNPVISNPGWPTFNAPGSGQLEPLNAPSMYGGAAGGATPSMYSFHAGPQYTRGLEGAATSRQESQFPPQPARSGPTQQFDRIYGEDGRVHQVEADMGSYYSDDEGFDERAFLNDYKDTEKEGRQVEVVKQTGERKFWVTFVWLLTFWIPSPILKWFGRMKRSDMRMAWREKLVIFFLIFLLNAGMIFYMIILGHLICPDYDKVWNHKELGTHQGTNDFYVGVSGKVYDLTNFYKLQHSDNGVDTGSDTMMPFAGQDITDYFPRPLWQACPNLVSDQDFTLVYNETLDSYASIAMHASGEQIVPSNDTALHSDDWYTETFLPKMKTMQKGDVVETPKDVRKKADEDGLSLFILNGKIYDVTRYMLTIARYPKKNSASYAKYNFFDDKVVNMFQNFQGQDVKDQWATFSPTIRSDTIQCLDNMFYYGKIDFRKSAKCQAANVILLVIAGILTGITLIKFLTSLRFVSKPLPSKQDRFVICQVPVYTESEDDVRLAIDSLTSMDYDNQHKLLMIICDGLVTGAGNDRTTPQIILDIFGVDDRIDPEPKAYHAISEGSKELNYAKVYSGLYEFEGNIVPYMVVVKCGSPSEASRPGNRGKRDSQLILMNFLNAVHYRAPMNPLELEIFHHMNNIIGVEPERYEYLFTVDADTEVHTDALTRMVAACTADNRIAAVCGETGIQNEQQSLSTMIQVYEYFISHHLTKAFESLFGSVTCLPGCFTLYRLKTHHRARPLLISNEIIREYSIRHVDTLHKKNLFSLGEDRYLTTLMSKYNSKMALKFIGDAKCLTRVPDDFSVLMSQRRRWINSTVHNLVELLRLKTLCGFCLLSMRGVVFVDLVGTLMLPSVVIYLVYLIYVIASKTSPLPIISIVLIASVYGLQALVYILHRRWQHIFWMIIYIAAYPFHSFILPIYSFWYMDDFGWGNTRVVVEETQGKKVVLQDENDVYDPRWVPMETWSDYASREGLPGAERAIIFDVRKGRVLQAVHEEFMPVQGFADNVTYRDDRTEFTTGRNTITPTVMASDGAFDAPTIARVRRTIRQVLNTANLENMTTRQLRDKVADLMGVEFTRQKALAVDEIIDEELDAFDDMDDEFQPVTNNV